MKSEIRLLSEKVANMIAAGEVIERPASVVKELVENSLDAGAHRILVDLKVGGRKLIRVVDDGDGMSHDDALLALERHATSKIRSETDLTTVATMGFRGEALPAIASVARLNLRTAQREQASGIRIRVEGGKILEVVDEAVAPGTEMEIVDLFFNTPGRRKFMRSPETELTHIVEAVTRLALPRRDVFFRLRQDSKTLLQVPAGDSFIARVTTLLGPDASADLVELSFEGRHFGLTGFISGPMTTRSSSSHMFVYCNGRFLRDRMLTHAINSGYRGHILKGRYPVVILLIDIPPELVDVNVHPTKSEVRFRKPSGVYEGIVSAIDQTLRKRFGAAEKNPFSFPLTPSGQPAYPQRSDDDALNRQNETLNAISRFGETGGASLFERYPQPATRHLDPVYAKAGSADAQSTPEKNQFPGGGVFSRLAIIGQLFNNYIVCETREGGGSMVLIDMHAAHERIIFEKLKKDYLGSSIPVQGQLIPVTMELRRAEAAALRKIMSHLKSVGIEVEPFGGDTFRITGVPTILSTSEAQSVVTQCIDRFLEIGQNAPPDHIADNFLSVLACHSAVRSGQELTTMQMREILKGLDAVDNSGACPHGRPTIWTTSMIEIEKRFKRR
jgi:DNA mismatch repair protein MutL